MPFSRHTLGLIITSLSLLAAACGSDSSSGPARGDDAGSPQLGDDQTPPTGADNVEAWLKLGAYQDWNCEPDVHASRDPSPHGFNRICSNDLLASMAQGQGNWPKGAAGVKELYDTIDGTAPVGYAVYLKTADDSAGGANWYWYERLANGSVAADGLGDTGTAKTICVGCHVAAGIDAAHTPSVGGRDLVYTPVSN